MTITTAKVHKKMDISPLVANNSKKVRIFAIPLIGVKDPVFYFIMLIYRLITINKYNINNENLPD